MFNDIDFKQSFTTFTSDTKQFCPCGNYNKSILQQKLEQILNSLYQDIKNKQKQIEQIQKNNKQNIKQKQQIIQRLVSANSKLTIENQILTKKLIKRQNYMKSAVSIVEAKYNRLTKQLNSQNKYLKQRNEQLKRQIIQNLYLIPQQHKPIQVTRSRKNSGIQPQQQYSINYNYIQSPLQQYSKSNKNSNRYISHLQTNPSVSSSKYQSRSTYTSISKSNSKCNGLVANKSNEKISYIKNMNDNRNAGRSSNINININLQRNLNQNILNQNLSKRSKSSKGKVVCQMVTY